jgi:hypothetical protein
LPKANRFARVQLCYVRNLSRTMPDQEWIKTLVDGRRVKFTNQELLETHAFITAQIESNKVVYSIVLTKVRNPLSHEEVEGYFEGELSKK